MIIHCLHSTPFLSHRRISLWWRTQAQKVSYQFILVRQFTIIILFCYASASKVRRKYCTGARDILYSHNPNVKLSVINSKYYNGVIQKIAAASIAMVTKTPQLHTAAIYRREKNRNIKTLYIMPRKETRKYNSKLKSAVISKMKHRKV